GKLALTGTGFIVGRDRRAGRVIQSNDQRTAFAARPPYQGGARRRLARTGPPPGARAQESAVPFAAHGREPAACQATQFAGVRGSIRRKLDYIARRDL